MDEKPSMGNGAMVQTAELEVSNKRAKLYLGSDKMEVINIIASLVSVYYEDETGNFPAAEKSSYDIDIPEETLKRPSVFCMPLYNTSGLFNVYVDPKVEPMGDDPIRARIKLDFGAIEKIDQSQAKLINKFHNGPKEPPYDPSQEITRQNKTIYVTLPPNSIDLPFSFYANRLSGQDHDKYKASFDALDQVTVFRLQFLGPLPQVQAGQRNINDSRDHYRPRHPYTIKLPLLKYKATDNLKVYSMDSGPKELDFKIEGDYVVLTSDGSFNYAVVKSNSPAPPKTGGTSVKPGSGAPAPKTSQKADDPQAAFIKGGKQKASPVQSSSSSSPVKDQAGSSPGTQANQAPGAVAPPPGHGGGGLLGAGSMETASLEDMQDLVDQDQALALEGHRESRGIIALIVIILVAMAGGSIYLIKRYATILRDELAENRYLKKWGSEND